MSTEINNITENNSKDENQLNANMAEEVNSTVETPEVIPSMDDFKDQLENSFRNINEGDIISGTVIGISDTEIILDLGYYTEGIIRLEEISNDPSFSIKNDITLGEEITATVIRTDDGEGHILLSKRKADNILAWDKLTEAMEGNQIFKVKISQTVNGGVITYLYGIRAFIPASQLSLDYVEDLESWVGKEIEVVIITASEEDNRLVLSGKEVEREKALQDKQSKISKLQIGLVTTGNVEKIMPYGAFVNIGEGLTGLLHISQISHKRIKSPNEVIKEGQEVTVKILSVKDGKISLSMKEVSSSEDVVDDLEDAPSSYSSGEEASTSLASLLKNIKL
jgi:small subunit ribosomal protein S1